MSHFTSNDTILQLLQRIAESLERIEDLLKTNYERSDRQLEIKHTRELMQDICKYYKNTEPSFDIQIDSELHIHRFREAIARVKNIRNTKHETRRIITWIRRLEDHEFIRKINAEMIQVLDTGQSWDELEE